MAIYSCTFSSIGATTHEAAAAAAHMRYILRPGACAAVVAYLIPDTRDRAATWITQQARSGRINQRICDKIRWAIPHELTDEQALEHVRDTCDELGAGVPYLAAIHHPSRDGDVRNRHVHAVFRDRHPRTGRRVMRTTDADAFDRVLATVERGVNRALARVGLDVRVDRRSLAAQGIDRIPNVHEGPAAKVLTRKLVVTGERPESRDRLVPRRAVRRRETRDRDGDAPRVVRYGEIDHGRTRAEENAERREASARCAAMAEALAARAEREARAAAQAASEARIAAARKRMAASGLGLASVPQPTSSTVHQRSGVIEPWQALSVIAVTPLTPYRVKVPAARIPSTSNGSVRLAAVRRQGLVRYDVLGTGMAVQVDAEGGAWVVETVQRAPRACGDQEQVEFLQQQDDGRDDLLAARCRNAWAELARWLATAGATIRDTAAGRVLSIAVSAFEALLRSIGVPDRNSWDTVLLHARVGDDLARRAAAAARSPAAAAREPRDPPSPASRPAQAPARPAPQVRIIATKTLTATVPWAAPSMPKTHSAQVVATRIPVSSRPSAAPVATPPSAVTSTSAASIPPDPTPELGHRKGAALVLATGQAASTAPPGRWVLPPARSVPDGSLPSLVPTVPLPLRGQTVAPTVPTVAPQPTNLVVPRQESAPQPVQPQRKVEPRPEASSAATPVCATTPPPAPSVPSLASPVGPATPLSLAERIRNAVHLTRDGEKAVLLAQSKIWNGQPGPGLAGLGRDLASLGIGPMQRVETNRAGGWRVVEVNVGLLSFHLASLPTAVQSRWLERLIAGTAESRSAMPAYQDAQAAARTAREATAARGGKGPGIV